MRPEEGTLATPVLQTEHFDTSVYYSFKFVRIAFKFTIVFTRVNLNRYNHFSPSTSLKSATLRAISPNSNSLLIFPQINTISIKRNAVSTQIIWLNFHEYFIRNNFWQGKKKSIWFLKKSNGKIPEMPSRGDFVLMLNLPMKAVVIFDLVIFSRLSQSWT